MEINDKRAYARGSHLSNQVTVSTDGARWLPAEASDISSGGLKLLSSTPYNEGDLLWFDLVFRGFMSEFEVKVQGAVRRKTTFGDNYKYGIQFINLSQDKKIQIDENIRNDRPIMGGGYQND